MPGSHSQPHTVIIGKIFNLLGEYKKQLTKGVVLDGRLLSPSFRM